MGVFFLNFLRALKGPTKNLLLRTTLFFVYLLFGAAVFQTIESGEERREQHHFDVVRKNMKEKYNISDADMSGFFKEISKAIDEGYFDVNYDRWSFTGSLFFTGTVVTTIGKLFEYLFLEFWSARALNISRRVIKIASLHSESVSNESLERGILGLSCLFQTALRPFSPTESVVWFVVSTTENTSQFLSSSLVSSLMILQFTSSTRTSNQETFVICGCQNSFITIRAKISPSAW